MASGIPSFSSDRWRLPLLIAGLLIAAAGHPRGNNMLEMLSSPIWVRTHSMTLAGLVAMFCGLLLYSHSQSGMTGDVRRWTRFVIVATGLEVVEMVVHTLAVVDRDHLAAGAATPVLSVHLAMTVAIYPIFAISLIGFIVASARTRAIGSWWLAPIGILGATAHGLAALLVIVGGNKSVSFLFAGIALVGLWLILAALWPLPKRATSTLGSEV